jgi:hypothetical protein
MNRKVITSPILLLRCISGNFGVGYLLVSFFWDTFRKRGLLDIGSDLLAYIIKERWMPRFRSIIQNLGSGAPTSLGI